MRESACLQGSGILMEAFVSKMTSDIMALDDITANESERLDQLCKMLYPLEQLFTSHHVSPRPYYNLQQPLFNLRHVSRVPALSNTFRTGSNFAMFQSFW